MATTIRPLFPADFSEWLPLWKGYQEFYDVDLSDEVNETTWARLMDPNEQMFALGAFNDEILVGISHYHLYRSTWLAGWTCYLHDLYTSPESRGRGVARALIEAVRDSAIENGAEKLFWLTHSTNSQARSLYDQIAQSTGFIHYRMPLA